MIPDTVDAIRAVDEMPDEELAAIARRIVHDPRVQRAEGIAGWWRRWAGSIAWVALIVVAAVGFFRVQGIADSNTSLANSTNNALCALRADLQRRVDQTETFLKHPENFPQFNDPKTVALIQQQIEGQQRTIVALSALSCD